VFNIYVVKYLIQRHTPRDIAGAAVGIDPRSMAERAEHGDTAGIVGQATLPTSTVESSWYTRDRSYRHSKEDWGSTG